MDRMLESLILFESLINSWWFLRTSIIIFFNQIDVFKSKLPKIPLEKYLPEYTTGPRYQQSREIHIIALHASQPHDWVYTRNTSNIRLVFVAVKEMILQNTLKDSGVLWAGAMVGSLGLLVILFLGFRFICLPSHLSHPFISPPFFTMPSSLFHSRALFTSGLVIPITNLHLPSHALSQHRTTYLNFVSRYLRANSPSSHQISSISYNLPFHFHELVFPVFPSWFPHPPRHFFMLITNAGGWITLPCSCVCIYAHTIFLLLPSFSRVLIPYYPLGETCGRCASQIEYTYGIMSVC